MADDASKTRKSGLRQWLRNPISMAGVALALVSAANIFLFVLIDLISRHPSPYIGILAYLLAPGFLLCGFLLIAVGAWRERRRIGRGGDEESLPYPRLDLNDAATRSSALSFVLFLTLFVMVSGAGSYKAYEFTESVQFCGTTCHVMHPQFTAYQEWTHARVACVQCHVGSGAPSYFRSKVSGTRQVIEVVLGNYPRPIPTPVRNLRPAQDTCEQCHWPGKSYGTQLKVFTHYGADEKNTFRQLSLLIKTGGGDPSTGAGEGIHWHMNLSNEIDFVATDQHRQIIPYIHVKDMQGRVTEYFAQDSKLTKDQIAQAPRHRMDCIDCHNRPAHFYLAPEQAVDRSLSAQRLDVSLPFIKQQAVAALTGKYETTDAATQAIAHDLQSFYESKYPDLAKSKQLEIRNSIVEIQQIFRRTTFPEMKLNWQTHPNNLGHLYFNGCFRCHDGQHVSPQGKVISKDCNLCHTVAQQQEGSTGVASAQKLSFQHPVDIGDLAQTTCSDCHTGGVGP
ncbi:MAG TPA: NapC/NirT family cytochrome c [Candidatus Sulfotelmatobacter sp.]